MKRSGGLKRSGALARTGGLRRSNGLARSQMKRSRKPIKPISEKTAERNAAYKIERDLYMSMTLMCEMVDCTSPSTDCHHREARSLAPDRVVDSTNFVALCRRCHDWVGANPEAAEKVRMYDHSGYELRHQVTNRKSSTAS